MKCKNCSAEWNVSKAISASLSECPFCKASLIKENDKLVFDNLHDALAAMYVDPKAGIDVVLGSKCPNYISDYFPKILPLVKARIKTISKSGGAAEILKSAMNADIAEKERAILLAIQKLTDDGDGKDTAKDIIYEYVSVLGWNVTKPQTAITTQQDTITKPQDAITKPQTAISKPQTEITVTPQSLTFTPQQKRNTAPVQTQLQVINRSGKTGRNEPCPCRSGKKYEDCCGATQFTQPIPSGGTYLFGNITWRVLDVHVDRALILTEDIIEKRRYQSSSTGAKWADCELREYLNGLGAFNGNGFIDKFDLQDRSRIYTVNNANPNNQWFGTHGGGNTTDQVFLLSIDEVVKYFGDSGQLKNKNPKSEYWISDQYKNKRIAKYKEYKDKQGKAWWWLRSPGGRRGLAACVSNDGYIYMIGYNDYLTEGGVRPALWLKLKS